MKTLDLTETVKNVDGEELKDNAGKPITFGHLLSQTLVGSNGESGDHYDCSLYMAQVCDQRRIDGLGSGIQIVLKIF